MIPSGFKVCGIDVDVKIIPVAEWHQYDPEFKNCGLYFADRGLLVIKDGQGPQQMQQTWFHEVMHVILSTMGHPLNSDEPFVDMSASLLHQIFTTITPAEKRSKRK